MIEEHPNAAAYRRTVDAFRAMDFIAVRSLIADDVVWHVPGDHQMAGEIRGLDALIASARWGSRSTSTTSSAATIMSSRSATSVPIGRTSRSRRGS
jgi:ketosteroid isomerase-like protein